MKPETSANATTKRPKGRKGLACTWMESCRPWSVAIKIVLERGLLTQVLHPKHAQQKRRGMKILLYACQNGPDFFAAHPVYKMPWPVKFKRETRFTNFHFARQRMYKWLFDAQLQTLRKSQSKPPMPIQHLRLFKWHWEMHRLVLVYRWCRYANERT